MNKGDATLLFLHLPPFSAGLVGNCLDSDINGERGVQTPDGNLSKGMRKLNGVSTVTTGALGVCFRGASMLFWSTALRLIKVPLRFAEKNCSRISA